MGGLPCIRGLRFPVATVLAMLADGMDTEDILAEHPDLTAEDIHESLLYAAEAVRERELPRSWLTRSRQPGMMPSTCATSVCRRHPTRQSSSRQRSSSPTSTRSPKTSRPGQWSLSTRTCSEFGAFPCPAENQRVRRPCGRRCRAALQIAESGEVVEPDRHACGRAQIIRSGRI